ncbi:hypothetical protein AAHA92_17332 [Salvia divinorum]|uniref:Uncharacterized protein n=1 Tax=Salvia divinorum TaxID=28513 RepID=A0ABD1GZN6_SALDI
MSWTLQEFPNNFFMTVAQEIEAKLAVHFTEAKLLKVRAYAIEPLRRFSVIRAHTGICMQSVSADCVWTKILKNNAFAGAYYYHDKPQYSKIAYLFGMDDVKVESAKEVIVISVSTEKLFPEDSRCYEVGGDIEKVN